MEAPRGRGWPIHGHRHRHRLMRERSIRDVDSAMRDARLVLEQNPTAAPYAHVVVDEAQDFSAPAFRLVRALAGGEHANDIFIVGDSHQRIYGKQAVLSRCGINMRGRARRLRVNYRTPEEIRKAAVAVISGLSWDDLDGADDGSVEDEITQSLIHGERPEVQEFRDMTAEIDWISDRIEAAEKAGLETKDICVVLRTNKSVDDYAIGLRERGHKTMVLKARREGNEAGIGQSERSLVYVAMTRTKRATVITASGKLTKLLAK